MTDDSKLQEIPINPMSLVVVVGQVKKKNKIIYSIMMEWKIVVKCHAFEIL